MELLHRFLKFLRAKEEWVLKFCNFCTFCIISISKDWDMTGDYSDIHVQLLCGSVNDKMVLLSS